MTPFEIMRQALQSIAGNSCCLPCREAGLVAEKALREAATALGGAVPASYLEAARHADWTQVVLNGGPPCFHLEESRSRFCLRAERWPGHPEDHVFISLEQLLVERALRDSSTRPQRTEPEQNAMSENQQAPANAEPFIDTPVLQARRAVFDNPTIVAIDALIQAVRRERAAPPVSEGWQQIEQCSITSRIGEERKRILVYGEMGVVIGYVIDYGDGTRHIAAEGFNGDWKITHWMPLPAPPAGSPEKG